MLTFFEAALSVFIVVMTFNVVDLVLLDPTTRAEEEWELRGLRMAVPFFVVGEYKVWGATAMILSEFVERLRAVV